MDTKIGKYDPVTETVAVTFTEGDIVHTREVNAVLKDNGNYDKAATASRVEDVARGVSTKIGLGVIKNAEPVSDPEPLTI